ncbi:MAG: preprotein translocase subunit YajC [Micrococcales bacterium]|nr:preprotein translocase subunit YajC [Micrococcales bacterium]
MEFIILIVVLFAVMWFVNHRKQRTVGEMRNTLAPGDEVMTGSGLFATVVSADGDVLVLETSPGVEQRWARAAVLRKVGPVLVEPAAAEAAAEAGAPAWGWSDNDDPDADPDIDEFEVPDDVSSLDPGGSEDPKP